MNVFIYSLILVRYWWPRPAATDQ